MKITQDFAITSACYRAGTTITPRGLMLHSVGCNQPDPKVFARFWKNSDDVCCHGVLGTDGTVIQTLPWNRRGWHCGGAANGTHIGIEMTEPSTIRYTGGASFVDNNPTATKKFVLGTYKTAVELFAYLCKMYNLNPLVDGVIISHSEGYKRGIASGHADVEHIWNKYGLTMNQFRKDVKAAMNGGTVDTDTTPKPSGSINNLYRVRKSWADSKSQIGAYSSLENAKKACKDGYTVYDADGKAVYPVKQDGSDATYKVRVSIDDLNIRTDAGTEYPTTGKYTGKGVFTIVETKDGWGRLKSGGWICLDFADKI
ncbi:MAG: peptidoglycan recognition protein family protein [Ruminococcus sp.]|nr:peptidoglycan recognition protein family protein [Ruminococcus sp.]